jgi:hypothetical protein
LSTQAPDAPVDRDPQPDPDLEDVDTVNAPDRPDEPEE